MMTTHAALANVYAVPSVVLAPAVGPAEQKWQRYFKSPRISSLDGSIHIRTQFPSARLLNISATRERHKRVIVCRPWGQVCAERVIRYFAVTTSGPMGGATRAALRGGVWNWTRDGCFPQAGKLKSNQ